MVKENLRRVDLQYQRLNTFLIVQSFAGNKELKKPDDLYRLYWEEIYSDQEYEQLTSAEHWAKLDERFAKVAETKQKHAHELPEDIRKKYGF